MTNEIEDLKRDSARLTWLIEEALAGRQHLDATIKREYARQYIDLKIATANIQADVERAREHQEMRPAAACAAAMQVYDVFLEHEVCILGHAPDPNRDTAIDKARGVK
jgi:hypothetical protein